MPADENHLVMNGTVYETSGSRASIGLKSISGYYPSQMQGSLNGMYRRKEMKRINNGNKVSFKI